MYSSPNIVRKFNISDAARPTLHYHLVYRLPRTALPFCLPPARHCTTILSTDRPALHYHFVYRPPGTALSFLRSCIQFLLARVSVFVKTIFGVLQSNCSFLTTHQMFIRAYWLSVIYLGGTAVGLGLPEYGDNTHRNG